MTSGVTVLATGPLTTVQDEGRPGLAALERVDLPTEVLDLLGDRGIAAGDKTSIDGIAQQNDVSMSVAMHLRHRSSEQVAFDPNHALMKNGNEVLPPTVLAPVEKKSGGREEGS